MGGLLKPYAGGATVGATRGPIGVIVGANVGTCSGGTVGAYTEGACTECTEGAGIGCLVPGHQPPRPEGHLGLERDETEWRAPKGA